ncbi:MAG: leucine-rich repeat domain-containing protein [Cyanobacteria bacterium P01_F01_bin.56]
MARTLTWLHLSDLHACKPRTGWDAKPVTDSLCADLKKMQEQQGLRPDLIFFTGDAAFGQIGSQRGEMIADQFREAHDFLETVRNSFAPAIEQRNVFLVPGNHDVNRETITTFEKDWLEQPHSLDKITNLLQKAGADWKQIRNRLNDYARFLDNYGYDHLLTQRERLIYADAREVAGVRIGIAGFNSAWSSTGAGRSEMGRLWMAGRYQLETLRQQMPPNDFMVALIHHPPNWLVPEENPAFGRQLEREFPFVLHGHEHQDFVRPNADTGQAVISAGACHEWSESKNNGYNFVRLDFKAGKGEVWLRQYDSSGGGWVPRCVHGRTDDLGCWPLNHLSPWIAKLADTSTSSEPPGAADDSTAASQAETTDTAALTKPQQQAADYETRYRQAVVNRLDYMQLFGIDVPKESKKYSLTVAYVSLNLADEAIEEAEVTDEDEDVELASTSKSAEEVFEGLGIGTNRLLIRGAAGCGKTTLLRWAAVQSGKASHRGERQDLSPPPELRERNWSQDTENDIPIKTIAAASDWRDKIPFVIRLRDCPNGQLPRPEDFHLPLAKLLPDPPVGWVYEVLKQGQALIMFDGVDEVPPLMRDDALQDISQLIKTYPDNYYVVTTRPDAVERTEFYALGFVSARVEPMTPADRNTFIERWHEAMEAQLRSSNESTDLRPSAKRLKQRLDDTPAVARLTVNPLLCAVVCALHLQRRENLPETPVDLCEKLCEMLLDRRDKERLKQDAQRIIDEAYGKIDFRVRKGLLSKLAHHMVLSGVSAISEMAADEQLAEALASYGLTEVKPATIRQALVERSGVLQESSEQRIEFLHNTLKEFLAAERFVNIGDVQSLATHADDPAWQPVILFVVALPRDGSSFATDLVRTILARTPLKSPGKGRSKAVKAQAAKLRAKQFFFFRCVTNAYQLNDLDIAEAFEQLSKQLLPPRNKTDAAVLATCGEAIIPYLKYQPKWSASARAACARTLSLIGGSRAFAYLTAYCADKTLTVNREVIDALLGDRHIADDVSALANLTDISVLDLSSVPVSDISALATLTNLQSLDLRSTPVSDVSALATLTNLQSLDLRSTPVSDVSALATLTNLQSLDLRSTPVSDVSALATLTNLQSLDLRSTQVSDVSALATLTNLSTLILSSTRLSGLNSLENITTLDLSWTQVNDVSALATLTNLQSLHLSSTPVSDVSALATLTNLQSLHLSSTPVSDVSALANLTNLQSLHLSSTPVSDVSALATLTNLQSLHLSYSKVSDVSALANLTNLQSLDLSFTQVSDVSALASLTNLQSLNLWHTQVSDVSALENLSNCRIYR